MSLLLGSQRINRGIKRLRAVHFTARRFMFLQSRLLHGLGNDRSWDTPDGANASRRNLNTEPDFGA
jgi:hypothetical protein